MINFQCQCGHPFSEPDDHAGRELQCPKCLRLVDVPTLSDLRAINPDGTYVLHESQPQTEQPIPTFDEMVHAFRRDVPALGGIEKDLRHTHESLANVGSLSLEQLDKVLPPPPRYDPETGELLTPVDMAPQVVKPIPIIDPNTGKTLRYASAGTDTHAVRYWRVPLELLKVANLAVMAFPFFSITFVAFACAVVAQLAFLPLGLAIMVGFVLLAHYGSVPHEMGYKERDDLPRPLGDLDWIEDVFAPMGNLLMAWAICYGPGLFVPHPRHSLLVYSGAQIALWIAGTFFFPAVFLTLTNGGSLLNLRPDRVVGVIWTTGLFYLVLVIEWAITAPLYGISVRGMLFAAYGVIYGHAPKWSIPVAMSVLALAIYLLYMFLWQLGLVFRKKGDHFPWILQRYVKVARS